MEQLISKTINHAKHVSKRKVSIDSNLKRKTSATNLDDKILKLQLDQMIIKGLIDQSYKILHRKRLHLENVGDNTAENLDKDQPFIHSQQTLLTKSQGISVTQRVNHH